MAEDSASPDKSTRHDGPRLAGIVTADTPAVSAASHILEVQFSAMRISRDAALTGSDPVFLHDLRVAARRFRAALSFFRPLLRGTSTKACGQHVTEFRRRLGAVRDAHVWLLFLEDLAARPPFAASDAFLSYLENCREADAHSEATLRSTLTGDAYAEVADAMTRFLREEVAEEERKQAGPLFGPFAARRLGKVFRRILRTDARVKRMSDTSIHSLRKKCRKARYYAEFSAGAFGKPIERLAKRFKRVTTTLGDIHDMDVRLQTLASGQAEIPPIVTEAIHRHRRNSVRAFEEAWRDLGSGDSRGETKKALRKAGSAS